MSVNLHWTLITPQHGSVADSVMLYSDTRTYSKQTVTCETLPKHASSASTSKCTATRTRFKDQLCVNILQKGCTSNVHSWFSIWIQISTKPKNSPPEKTTWKPTVVSIVVASIHGTSHSHSHSKTLGKIKQANRKDPFKEWIFAIYPLRPC